jgi:hypothetical protein
MRAISASHFPHLNVGIVGCPDRLPGSEANVIRRLFAIHDWDLVKLETDPALLTALQTRSLIEKGLDLIDGPDCPLCDTPWEDEQHLRSHLEAKLAKSEEARKLQQSMLSNGTVIATEGIRVIGLLVPVQKLADTQGDGSFTTLLTLWKADLEALKAKLATVDGLTGLKDRLTAGWLAPPEAFLKGLKALTEKIEAKPDQTATLDAQTFLTTAQLRLGDYREAMRKNKTGHRYQFCKLLKTHFPDTQFIITTHDPMKGLVGASSNLAPRSRSSVSLPPPVARRPIS